MEPALKRAKLAKHAECRAAARAAERAEWLGSTYEVSKLLGQAEEVNRDDAVCTTEEYDLILRRLREREAASKAKYTKKMNENEGFHCSICLDRCPLDALRLFVPCGHGLCQACMSECRQATKNCPSCNGPVDDVVRAFV